MEDKGFLQGLFDFSFKTFITQKVISVLYILSLVAAVVWALVTLVSATSGASVLMVVIGLPLAVIAARVYLEIVVVLFTIANNTSKLVSQQEANQPPQQQ